MLHQHHRLHTRQVAPDGDADALLFLRQLHEGESGSSSMKRIRRTSQVSGSAEKNMMSHAFGAS